MGKKTEITVNDIGSIVGSHSLDSVINMILHMHLFDWIAIK